MKIIVLKKKIRKKEDKKHRHRYFSIFFLIIDRHMKTVDDTDVAGKFWKSLPTLQNQRGPCCANKGVALKEPQSSSTYATWFSWKNKSFKNIGITKDLLQTAWIPLKSLMNGLLEQHHIRHTHHYREFVVRLSLSASMKHKSKGFACPASTSSANCRNPCKAFCFRSWIRWDKALRWIMSSHKDSAHLWWTYENVKYGATTDWRNWSTLQATIVIIVSLLEAACVCAEITI